MVTTLEGLRCLSRKAVWDLSQALQKDIYETLALLRGERQQTLTVSEVMTLARCLGVSFDQVVAAANTSYAVNCYHRLALPLEATTEQIMLAFRMCVKEASDGKGGYKEDIDRLVQAKELALDFRQRLF